MLAVEVPPAGLALVAVAAVLGLLAWRATRHGRAWAGPEPPGDLPDTSVAVGVALFLWLAGHRGSATVLRWSGVLAAFAFTAVNVLVAAAVLRPAVSVRPPEGGVRRALLAAAVGLFLIGVVQALQIGLAFGYDVLGYELPTQGVVELMRNADLAGRSVLVLVAVVLAPFAEEVFFRGVLWPALARLLGAHPALLVQAVVFGLIHFLGVPEMLPLTVPLMVAGYGFGWLRMRTGSLWAAVFAHAVFNGVQVAFLLRAA